MGFEFLAAPARQGHVHVVWWLMSVACMQVDVDMASEAACGGHVSLIKYKIAEMGPDA